MIWLILIAAIAFIWHCPIFKPHFGWTCKWTELGK